MNKLPWLICAVIAFNLILFVLTFVPAFSGIGGAHPGMADRLFGDYRFGGWRADVVWMVTSTVGILAFGLLYSLAAPNKTSRTFKLVSASCAIWLGCFLVYAHYVLMHMMG